MIIIIHLCKKEYYLKIIKENPDLLVNGIFSNQLFNQNFMNLFS